LVTVLAFLMRLYKSYVYMHINKLILVEPHFFLRWCS